MVKMVVVIVIQDADVAWRLDISLAASKGFDAFALNVGNDDWQPARVADAYTAAQMCRDNGLHFKLFLSFDMTSLPCSSAADADLLRSYINSYHSNINQLHYDGNPFVSTFAGESCSFGQDSVNDGWTYAVKSGKPAIYFVPSFFVDPSQFSDYTVIDGMLNVSRRADGR
jgi:glucan endo-1,3-alpha-glucosidase